MVQHVYWMLRRADLFFIYSSDVKCSRVQRQRGDHQQYDIDVWNHIRIHLK